MLSGFLLLLLFRFQNHNSKLRESENKRSQVKQGTWGVGGGLNIILNTSLEVEEKYIKVQNT